MPTYSAPMSGKPWAFHRGALPEPHRPAFDEWMEGARELDSFIPDAWRTAPPVAAVLQSHAWKALDMRLREEYLETAATRTPVYPLFHLLFRPLVLCATPASVRVIIPAAEPYADGRADGLAFSVRTGERVPDTVRNILQVRTANMKKTPVDGDASVVRCASEAPAAKRARTTAAGEAAPDGKGATTDSTADSAADSTAEAGKWTHALVSSLTSRGCLDAWALQGVLLLNMHMSVRNRAPKSHIDFGWVSFSRACCEAVFKDAAAIVCLLMGSGPRTFLRDLARANEAVVVETTHPCDLTWNGVPDRPNEAFRTCEPFIVVNEMLFMQDAPPIIW